MSLARMADIFRLRAVVTWLFSETSVYYNSVLKDALAEKQIVSPRNTPKNS